MNIKEIDATWDRLTRNNLNDNFDEIQKEYTQAGLNAKEAKVKALEAFNKAGQALLQSERTEKELSQAILKGDSSSLGGQLSVGANGTVYHDPQERLVKEHSEVMSQISQKSTVQKEILTVKVPSDYLSVNAAIKDLSQRKHTYNITIDIILESGYQFTIPLLLSHGDYGHFRISSEDDVVNVSEGFPENSDLMTFRNCRAPILNCLINANARCKNGINVFDSSTMYITPGSGLIRAKENNLNTRYASVVYAERTNFKHGSQAGNSDSGHAGIVAWGSIIYAYGADVSDSLTYGAQAAHGGTLHFRDGIAENCGRHGVRSTNAGTVDARDVKANNCGVHGFYALGGSTMNARGGQAKDCGSVGVNAYQASTIDARDAIVDGSNIGVQSSQGSTINFFGGSALNCVQFCLYATANSKIVGRSSICSGATTGLQAEEGSEIHFFLGTLVGCKQYGLYALDGSKIVANVSNVSNTIHNGSLGFGAFANNGSKINVRGAKITGSSQSDLRVNEGSIINAHGCQTSKSTGDSPHIGDINLASFNNIQSSLGIIWATVS